MIGCVGEEHISNIPQDQKTVSLRIAGGGEEEEWRRQAVGSFMLPSEAFKLMHDNHLRLMVQTG